MKPFGHSRRDKLECKYGCCTTKSGKNKNCRKIVDKTKRKAGRRFFTDLIEDDTISVENPI